VVNSASALSLFRENLYNLENRIEPEKAHLILEEAMESWTANSNLFYRAKIMNLKGEIVATTKSIFDDSGESRGDRDYFIQGLKGPYVSDPYMSADDKVAGIAYASPILAPGLKKQVIGVLVIHQATDAAKNKIKKGDLIGAGIGVNQITNNSEGLGRTGETYLINQEGLLITDSRFNKDEILKTKIDPAMRQERLTNSGLLNYKDYRGQDVVGGYQKIAGTNWALIGEFDTADVFSPVSRLATMMIILGVIILVLVVLLAYFIAGYFTRPIVLLTEAARSIALGDLNQPIKVNMDDEIGQLAESFRTMQNSMRVKTQSAIEISEGNLLTDIQPLSDKDSMGIAFQTMVAKLRLQLKDISEGINVLASSSSEIMASVTQLASNSAETATSVGETTTTVEEVKQTAMVSNQRAKLVSENSIKIADISKEGNRAIANTIEGMSRIKQHMGAIANMVVKLSEQSQTIGEITASVNELAEQSNLLAVNAAIEAAKAGEQGKGFTVVAQEIKMLAERSKEATAQVRVILRDVQKSISSAVMATEEGTKAVEEGLKLTNQSGDTIRILSESVAEAANVAIQIAASSQQQLEGMDQVVVAMENIREASTQTVISTQQSVDSVNDLQKVGQKLDALMKQYRLFK
jgi:methyl-accepting chemotaxis protein